MKSLIHAGGFGTRLRPMTLSRPTPVRVGGAKAHHPVSPEPPARRGDSRHRHRHLVSTEHGHTQRDVSRETGIDNGVISRLLSGEREMTPEHMRRLGKLYRVPPGLFL